MKYDNDFLQTVLVGFGLCTFWILFVSAVGK